MASEMWKEEWQAVCAHARACSNYWLDCAWQIWSLQNGWPRLPPPRPPSTPPPLRQHLPPLPHLQQPPMPRAAWTTEPRPRSAHAVRTHAHTHTHTRSFMPWRKGCLLLQCEECSVKTHAQSHASTFPHTHTPPSVTQARFEPVFKFRLRGWRQIRDWCHQGRLFLSDEASFFSLSEWHVIKRTSSLLIESCLIRHKCSLPQILLLKG